MKLNKPSIGCLLVLSLIITPLSAGVYKCINSEGQTTFKQFPCDENDTEKILRASTSTANSKEQNNDKNIIITKNQLIGSWSDFNSKNKYASTWTFTSLNMTFKKYNGRVIKLTYTLKNNTLLIHHKKI